MALGLVNAFTPISIEATAERPFIPRMTAPDPNDPRFTTYSPFYGVGLGMPNCTAYAWGRAYEILGHAPQLNRGHSRFWFTNGGPFRNDNDRFERGQTPRLGAIAVWGPSSAGGGHVSVVEYVFPNGSFITSGSVFGGTFFYTRLNTSIPSDFQGFIYLGNFTYTPTPLRVIPQMDIHIHYGDPALGRVTGLVATVTYVYDRFLGNHVYLSAYSTITFSNAFYVPTSMVHDAGDGRMDTWQDGLRRFEANVRYRMDDFVGVLSLPLYRGTTLQNRNAAAQLYRSEQGMTGIETFRFVNLDTVNNRMIRTLELQNGGRDINERSVHVWVTPPAPDLPPVFDWIYVDLNRPSEANGAPFMINNLVNLRGLQEVLGGTTSSEVSEISGRRITVFTLPHAGSGEAIVYIYQNQATILLGDFIFPQEHFGLVRVEGSWYLMLDSLPALVGFTGFVQGDNLYLHVIS